MLSRIAWVAFACAALGCSTTVQTNNDSADGGGGTTAQGGSGGVPIKMDVEPYDTCPESGECQYTECTSPAGAVPCAFQYNCSLREPCGAVNFERDESTGDVTLHTPNEARCMLTSLRDGIEGSYHWWITNASLPGQYASVPYLHVRPDRVALRHNGEQFDVSRFLSYEGPIELQDPAYFEACIAETEANAIFDCLQNATIDSCAP